MIQDIFPRVLDNQYKNVEPNPNDWVLWFQGENRGNGTICLKLVDGNIEFPKVSMTEKKELQYLFSIDEERFFLLKAEDDSLLEDGFEMHPIGAVRKYGDIANAFAAMTGFHLYVWYSESHFCGKCGGKTVHDDKLRMVRCSKCGHMIFPKIAPAVIIGLRYGDSIMISRYAGRAYKGRALLAGFCEIGETPEETVVREVTEEVGLKATNVTYFGSQPWGLDSNLLLGYFADVEGDINIRLDEEELESAGFVKREDIEPDDNLMSLTATMIEEFRMGRDRR